MVPSKSVAINFGRRSITQAQISSFRGMVAGPLEHLQFHQNFDDSQESQQSCVE